MTTERGSTYLRLPHDLKERTQDYAGRRGLSLTSAIADLLEKGLTRDEINDELIQARSQIAKLEADNRTLAEQGNRQAQAIQGLQHTLATYQEQIQQLNQWLRFPIARCKQHCEKEATIVQVVYNQCPQTRGPSPYGFELLPQFEKDAPIDVIRNFGPLVGVAGVLIALASADSQKKE